MKNLITFIIILAPALCSAQQSVLDSLTRAFEQADNDTARIQILKKIAWEYYFNDPTNAPKHANNIITFSKKIGNLQGIWDGHNILGVIHYTDGNYDSAILLFKESLQLSNDAKYLRQRIYTYDYLINSLRSIGDYTKAQEYAIECLNHARASGDARSIAKAYIILAGLHYDQGKYYQSLSYYLKTDSVLKDEISIDHGEVLHNIGMLYNTLENNVLAKKYYARAFTIYEAMNDNYGVYAITQSMGNIAMSEKDYTKAKRDFQNALSFFQNYNDPVMAGNSHRYLGRAYYYLGSLDSSLFHYEHAVEIMKSLTGNVSHTHTHKEMGETYLALKKYDQALSSFLFASQLAEKHDDLTARAETLKLLVQIHAKQENFEMAFKAQQDYLLVMEELNAVKNSKAILEIEAKYENHKKEQEIELLEVKSALITQDKKRQQILFITALAGAGSLMLVLFLLYKTKQKANRKLLALDQLRSSFIANISHEFRTPLTLIMGPVQKKLASSSESEGDRYELEMIERNSRNLLELVDQLMELSRLEAGNRSVRICEDDIYMLLRAISSPFHYLASTKEIEFLVDIPDEHQKVWFDRDAIQKILNNLLSNAMKYTPANGIVKMKAIVEGDRLRITVSNSGTGISKQDLPKIFDRYFQAEGKAGGIGIGLALVKELVDLLSGRIIVDSVENVETQFTVIVPTKKEAFKNAVITNARPLSITDHQNTLAITTLQTATDEDKPVVLVVDDHADIRLFVKSILRDQYNVVEAIDGSAGIATALQIIPDLVLSDVMMPGVDGLTLCRELKSDERTSHIPILLLTAKSGDEHTLAGFETGADDYIVKPFNSAVLLLRIEKLIAIRKALHEKYRQEVVLRPKEIAITSADEAFLEKVKAVLDTSLTESSFSTEDFARQIGMSRMQLHRKLKALTGLSANSFIRSQRLKLASTLLLKPDINVADVCYLAGFNDPSYFTKCFKEAYGCTPSEFIAQHGH